MKIIVKATAVELNEALNQYIEMRFRPIERLVKHWDEQGELELKVEIARTTKHHLKGEVYYAEASLALPKKSVLRSEATNADLRSAIDEVHDELTSQIEKYRDVKLTKIRRGARFIKRLFRGDR